VFIVPPTALTSLRLRENGQVPEQNFKIMNCHQSLHIDLVEKHRLTIECQVLEIDPNTSIIAAISDRSGT